MSLPLPPKLPLPMPPLPAKPAYQYDPDVDENQFTHVSKVERDKALVRIGNNRAFLSRSDINRLIGQLERVVRRL